MIGIKKHKLENDIRQLLKSPKGWRRLLIFVATMVLLEVISAIQYYYTHHLLEEELERQVVMELRIKNLMLRETMNSAEKTLEDNLWDIQRNLHHPDSMFGIMQRLVTGGEKVVGACMAFIPDYYREKGRLFEPYAYEAGDSIKIEQLGGKDGHDYTAHPAFQWVVEHREKTWSDPYEYESETGPQSLTSFSYPLIDADGDMAAVCALDVSLTWLGDTLNVRHLYPSSFGLFLTQGGERIAGPGAVSKTRQQKVVALINDSTVERMPTDRNDVSMIPFYDDEKGDKGYIYYNRMDSSPYWQVALVCYEKEVFGKVDAMRLRISLLMLLGFLLLGYLILRHLRSLIRLQEVNMEKERIGSELRIARDIQKQMLPETFPPFPERQDIDIYGSLVPAKEVGGDLFDFFISDEQLFFCIGDVSGKGIPSAMVMAQTHSLFRVMTARESEPAKIVQGINTALCEGNESNMFITFFLGILDLGTGHLRYCNAGHDHPFFLRDDATPELLPAVANIPLGLFDDFNYEQQEATLSAGTTIFLYTDGLTEAKNIQRKLFGMERTTATLNPSLTCQQLLESMTAAVHRFVKDAEQSDDLTMLAICYCP